MHKIITSDFEIDLTPYNISMQEENSWFSDTFFTKYSFPFDLIITDEINKALGDVQSFDSKSGRYYVECQYVFMDKIESAVMIIEKMNKNTASISIKYGMDEFPGFDKQLNELDLYQADIPDIHFHASVYVTSSYPTVNHNFPMIHTDKYDPSTAEFNGFQNIINNRNDNGFIANTVEEVEGEDVMFNRNIIQPMPYLMYVLKRGFELSGLELKGDIVNDELLQKILIFAEKDPFGTKDVDPITLSLYADEINMDGWTPSTRYKIARSVTISQPGKYNVIGDFSLIGWGNGASPSTFIIYKDNVALYLKNETQQGGFTADTDFILSSGSCEIKMEIYTVVREDMFSTLFDFQILPVYYIDSAGKKETNIINLNQIDLRKNVPNMTFGSFVTEIMNLFNYDVDSVTADEIVINKITKSMRQNEILDLSMFENIEVERTPNYEVSYLLKYEEEGDVDLGGFYIDQKESKYVTKEFKKQVQNTISLNVYPLQNELINDVFTAKSVQSADDKLCLVIYDGFQNGKNTTVEPIALAIPNLVTQYHYDWLVNRVHCTTYNFSFTADIHKITYLKTKVRAFCYNNIHLIKNISKTQLPNELFEVEIETETLVEL